MEVLSPPDIKIACRPNILVTGTPGTGKTSLCSEVAAATGFAHINVGSWVKDKELHDGFDDKMDCHILNEDKLLDAMEDTMDEGGNLVDYHSCDFFPERWFDLVVVLQCDNTELWKRLEKRGYGEEKIKENVQCEVRGCLAGSRVGGGNPTTWAQGVRIVCPAPACTPRTPPHPPPATRPPCHPPTR